VFNKAYEGLQEGRTLLILEMGPKVKTAYRYRASYMSDKVLYPLSKVYSRTLTAWNVILRRIGFKVKIEQLILY